MIPWHAAQKVLMSLGSQFAVTRRTVRTTRTRRLRSKGGRTPVLEIALTSDVTVEFQKAEADIEYVEKRLKFDFMTSARENGTVEGNPIQLLENLQAVKARHAALCAQVQEIAAEQKRSMESVRAHLDTTVKLVEELQNRADVQVPPFTEAELEARGALCSSVATVFETLPDPVVQKELNSQRACEKVTEVEFEAVPRSIRGKIKLADLNTLYKELVEHFSVEKNREPLSMQKMKKLNVKFSDSALKTLQHLSLIEVDKKGLVSLASRD